MATETTPVEGASAADDAAIVRSFLETCCAHISRADWMQEKLSEPSFAAARALSRLETRSASSVFYKYVPRGKQHDN